MGRKLAVLLTALLLAGGAVFLFRGTRTALVPRSPRERAEVRAPVQNVVLITIDTLRADAPGFSGNRKAETPNLDRLAAEGLVFESAHASNVVTLASHTNILTGLYPYQHGVRENSGFRLDPRFPTMATLLSRSGFATAAIVGAFPLDARYGLNRGFDVYDDRYPPGVTSYDFALPERPGTEVVALALDWYRKNEGRRRFLWVHLYDPHAPYLPPAPFRERYAGDPYLGEVAATDAALGPLLELLEGKERGSTLVVVTGDHGEALGDHGELTHSLFAYEATLKIPLVLWCPSRVQPGRSALQVGHVDILPTVLELAGATPPADLPGRSLMQAVAGETTYFESLSASLNRGWAPLTGVIADGLKYVDLPIPELYDLKADPQEKQNLVGERPDAVRRLKALLPNSARAASPRATSEEARRLLALGYLSGSADHHGPYTAADDPKTLVALDAKIHRVIDFYQRGDRSAARALAAEILRDRPTMSVGYDFLSFLLQREGRDAEAASVLQSAVRRGLASEAMRRNLALILCEQGRPAEGLEALKPFAQSDDPDTQNTIGIALTDLGRTAEALGVFEEVARKHPTNPIAFENMGIALLKSRDAAGALERLNRALAINEKLPRSLNTKGVAQMELGDSAGAIASWSRAVDLDPRQYDALLNLGVVAAQRGERDLARDALRRFVATAPPALYSKDLQRARRMLKEMGGS
ncbi:MAG TPA: sulfatase-like hydrolase/transferase [Thermoanaerobaculia bacterium]|nr:sulfatase-like hydrolase/transferase [Thermoanaerobaculia bacterium]